MKVCDLLEILGALREENGDCEVFAGLAGLKREFKVTDAAYLEEEPPDQDLRSLSGNLKPRIVLALELVS